MGRPLPLLLLAGALLAAPACRSPRGADPHGAPVRDFDELWDHGRPAETEARFRALLDTPPARADEAYRAELLTQIARTQGLQRDFEGAHRTLDEVAATLDARSSAARARYLLERGRVFNSAGDPGRARPLFEEAFELSRRRGLDVYAVDAAHMVAITAGGDEATLWNERALALARASADPRARRWQASLLNNLGWTRHEEGDYAAALELFQAALAERVARGEDERALVARWCVARSLRSLGRVEEALEQQRELAALREAAGTRDGFVEEELGECLALLGREGEAQRHFARAHELLSADPWLAEREPERLLRLARLGGLR